jgi:hypothetical protein
MSTFSTKGGLYERAARRFGLADGMRLFSYAFFDKQRLEALVRCCRVFHLDPCCSLGFHDLRRRGGVVTGGTASRTVRTRISWASVTDQPQHWAPVLVLPLHEKTLSQRKEGITRRLSSRTSTPRRWRRRPQLRTAPWQGSQRPASCCAITP